MACITGRARAEQGARRRDLRRGSARGAIDSATRPDFLRHGSSDEEIATSTEELYDGDARDDLVYRICAI